MLTNSITKRLETDADWQQVHQHILENIVSLDTVADIDFSDKEKATIEGRARVLAIEKLKAILEPFFGPQESTSNNKKHLADKTGML